MGTLRMSDIHLAQFLQDRARTNQMLEVHHNFRKSLKIYPYKLQFLFELKEEDFLIRYIFCQEHWLGWKLSANGYPCRQMMIIALNSGVNTKIPIPSTRNRLRMSSWRECYFLVRFLHWEATFFQGRRQKAKEWYP